MKYIKLSNNKSTIYYRDLLSFGKIMNIYTKDGYINLVVECKSKEYIFLYNGNITKEKLSNIFLHRMVYIDIISDNIILSMYIFQYYDKKLDFFTSNMLFFNNDIIEIDTTLFIEDII